MTELIGLIAGLLLGLAAMLLDRRRRAKPAAPPPKNTAQEHQNAHQTDTDAAVEAAADAHDVPAATVADDLDWLDADNVPIA